MAADLCPRAPVFDEHAGNKYAFGHRPFAGTGDLEALARMLGKAVEVQTVVPVGTADQRQAVRAQMRPGIVEAAAQMLQQRLCQRRIVVKVHRLVEDAPVAGLPQIGVRAGDEPERIVVEAAAHGQIALFGQRLVLVIGAAVGKLRRRNVQDPLTGTFGDHMYEAQQVLTGIAEAHPAAHAAFIIAGRAAHVEGDHALVLVPDVDHAVQLLITAADMICAEQRFPVSFQHIQRLIERFIVGIAGHHGLGLRLVDDAGLFPFLFRRVLQIAQAEDQAAAFAGLQLKIELLGGDGLPAVCHAAGAAAAAYGLRPRRAAVQPEEGLPGGVKAVWLTVGPENGVVIAALAVFGLVIDRRADDLHLADGVIALEVGAVVHRVPEAELHIGEDHRRFRMITGIADLHAHQQAVVPLGDEELLRHGKAVFFTLDHRVTEPVTAAVGVKPGLHRLPARIPDRCAIPDIEMKALLIQRRIIITVAGQAAEPGVAVERIAAGGIGAESEEVLAAQIVDPGQRCLGRVDHVFLSLIIKKAVFHRSFSLTVVTCSNRLSCDSFVRLADIS